MAERLIKILIADSDVSFSTLLAEYLTDKGYSVMLETNGIAAEEQILSQQLDFLLIDVSLLRKNGLRLLSDLRKLGNDTPAIVLARQADKDTILKAYECGCDDFVLKPFSLDILICKIKAVLRRVEKPETQSPTVYTLGNKVFDAVRQTFDGQSLPARESELLALLCNKMGQIVDKHTILRQIWQKDDYFAARSMLVYLSRIRKLLEDTPYKILLLRGKGYKLVES